jgi:hypothetical protein
MVIVYWLLVIVSDVICGKRACRLRQITSSIVSDERIAWLERACRLTQTRPPLTSPKGENIEKRGDSSPFFVVEYKKIGRRF